VFFFRIRNRQYKKITAGKKVIDRAVQPGIEIRGSRIYEAAKLKSFFKSGRFQRSG